MQVRGFLILGSLLALLTASCRVTAQSLVRSQQTDDYQRLEIIYQAHPAHGPLFTPQPQPSPAATGVIQVAAEVPAEPAPFHNMVWSKAELRIECPHPDGRSDVARVTLHFRPVECGHECERKSWGEQMEERMGWRQLRRATFRERWFYDAAPAGRGGNCFIELDLPKSELEAILAELQSHGFFDESRSPDCESQLEVRLNRCWTSKRWGYEPTLDALTNRVYQEGIPKSAVADAGPQGDRGRSFTWLDPIGRFR